MKINFNNALFFMKVFIWFLLTGVLVLTTQNGIFWVMIGTGCIFFGLIISGIVVSVMPAEGPGAFTNRRSSEKGMHI